MFSCCFLAMHTNVIINSESLWALRIVRLYRTYKRIRRKCFLYERRRRRKNKTAIRNKRENKKKQSFSFSHSNYIILSVRFFFFFCSQRDVSHICTSVLTLMYFLDESKTISEYIRAFQHIRIIIDNSILSNAGLVKENNINSLTVCRSKS